MLKAWKWDYIFLLEALSNSCAYRVPLLSMKWSPTHHHYYHQYDDHHHHQSGCTFECKLAVGRERTGGCTPWYYPRYVNVSDIKNICITFLFQIPAWTQIFATPGRQRFSWRPFSVGSQQISEWVGNLDLKAYSCLSVCESWRALN